MKASAFFFGLSYSLDAWRMAALQIYAWKAGSDPPIFVFNEAMKLLPRRFVQDTAHLLPSRCLRGGLLLPLPRVIKASAGSPPSAGALFISAALLMFCVLPGRRGLLRFRQTPLALRDFAFSGCERPCRRYRRRGSCCRAYSLPHASRGRSVRHSAAGIRSSRLSVARSGRVPHSAARVVLPRTS